jgi:hypothetical protein
VPCAIFKWPNCNVRGEGRKTLSGSKVKCPLLLPNFNLNCTATNACAGSAMWHITDTQLQSEGRYRRKTVVCWRIKCPSLLADYNLTCTAGNGSAGRAMWHISVNQPQWEGRYRWKTSTLEWKVPLITEQLQPNWHCLQHMRRECHVAYSSHPSVTPVQT